MSETLSELRLRAQRRADMENSGFVSDAEWDDYINEGLAELHEIVVDKNNDFIVKSDTLTVANGESATTLPADFLKVRGVDVTIGSRTYALDPFMFKERDYYQGLNGTAFGPVGYMYQIVGNQMRILPAANGSQSFTLWYIPQVQELTSDNQSINVAYASGWERYVVLYAAIKALQKEESDVSIHMQELLLLQKRVERNSNRTSGEPKRIIDVRYSRQHRIYQGGT